MSMGTEAPAIGIETADTMPAPSYKACACGRAYNQDGWTRLVHVGVYVDEVEYLDFRNCACGSTLAVDLESGAG